MAKILSVFPPDEQLRNDWKTCFTQAGYQIVPYDESLLAQTVVLLLFTPFFTSDEEWISPEPVWKQYLAEYYPAIKVIQAGYRNNITLPNYLHWETPPNDIETFIKQCQLSRDWEPLETYGLDLRKLWAKFRDGHDKSGFMDWANVASRRTVIALDKLIEEKIPFENVLRYLNDDIETIEAFDNVISRWSRYSYYFAAAPFAGQLQEIANAISRIDKRWSNCNTTALLTNQLTSLQKDFDTIENTLQVIEPWFKI